MKKLGLTLVFLLLTFSCSAQGFFSGLLGDSKPKGPKVKFVEGDSKAQEEVLLISLQGVIREIEEDDSPMMALRNKKSMIESLKQDLSIAAKRDAIKAVYIDINSPGGEVTASDIIHHLIQKFYRETRKPVIAHIGAMGASGAYYAACGCNKIFAMPTSMIGSIGVLLQSINVEELANKLGIKATTIKSDKTPMKDVLSPLRPATEEEKAMLLELVEDSYQRFVDIVSASRNLKREEVIKLANGSIYTANKSLKLGLIDGIAYREEVIDEICKLCELKSIALVKRMEAKNSLSELFGMLSENSSDVRPMVEAFLDQLAIGNTPILMFK